MFGGLINLAQSATIGPPPKDVPPPTPIGLPQCNPQLPGTSSDGRPRPPLVPFLQRLQRPAELTEAHFAALGVHVHPDAPAEHVVPNPACLPESAGWADMDLDGAQRKNETFRRKLSNGNLSPEARVYLERRAELSIPNQAAFRTIRRIKPDPGKQQVRLGNCYEFFKQMELMATYWDDTSLPPLASDGQDDESPPPLPPRPDSEGAKPGQPGQPEQGATAATDPEPSTSSPPDSEAKREEPERVTYRTSPGAQMPPEFRHSLIAAFVKLVAYDFGCNVVPPRVEPRLQLLAPLRKSKSPSPQAQVASYFPSGCVFLCRSPTTREAARAGIVEGPIAAVSARNTTNFSLPTDSNVDFGREIVAALITAQHRAREGQTEKRFGEGKWWATEKRWGGGEGGPIGREVDGDSVVGDKDSVGPSESGSADGAGQAGRGAGPSQPQDKGKTVPIPMRGPPLNKKPRKNLSIYDNYRMVRLPSSNWDKKTKYMAIGKAKGADYDDVFVLSSLFHHLCVLRVRVPARLLAVLGGEPEGDDAGAESGASAPRSWGRLEMWRSKWFDLFIPEERLEALRLLWGVMAWVMRADEETGEGGGGGKDDEKAAAGSGASGGDVVMRDV
ncbi:hypothetical protein GGS23DRAFT_253802 [Durotheca rogersii]|uniref:uncharacterized protein n=1 Tax=Durotheca rogersii TaxID=419775 RepID=UPI00221FDA28|nr:uncharacterized protein GGS23DRAFT_253802 [Durotheca rogersii]KAI5859910.1 hypothetical protein GGS23DRAFT_253802 [Durotheca rogersii]